MESLIFKVWSNLCYNNDPLLWNNDTKWNVWSTSKDFPEPLMKVAYLLPTTYICGDFIDFWQKGSYNFMPYIQSLVLLTAVALIVLFLAINYDSRYKHQN